MQNKKSKKKFYIWSFIFIIIVGTILFFVFSTKGKDEIIIQTEKVKRRNITQTVIATGKIQPETSVKINAEISGEIVLLAVKEGMNVNKGQLLVKIKSEQYEAQVKQQEAGLNSQNTSLLISQAQLKKQQNDFLRIEELYKKNLVSKQEFDASKTSLEVSEQQVENQKFGIEQAEAALNQSKESLSKTTIFSPMNGTISELPIEIGERVSGSQFTQGTHILTVADLTKMEARVEVNENDVVLISIGDTARIEIDAFPQKKFNGIVYEIANTATTKGFGTQDEVTNFEVKIRIISTKENLRPGMSMTATIETETKQNVLSIPIQSVTAKEDENENEYKNKKMKEIVFVVQNNSVKTKEVKRGISNDEHVEITNGLNENEEIVSGSFKAINRELEDGSKIKIDNEKKKNKKKEEDK